METLENSSIEGAMTTELPNKHNTLFLILKKEYYSLIESGAKREEYRRVCPRFDSMIWRKKEQIKYVVFQLGYSGKQRQMFRIEGVGIYDASSKSITHPCFAQIGIEFEYRAEWGFCAEQNLYVLRLGDKIS